ncbi:hypothetical protein HN801_04425 [Candidatus Peregrinibacteria bacterium]|nr:hypothetical protein [Candidatus Peregrinibacteria bacterium]
MHRFWNHIIQAICNTLQVQSIVEIGVEEGKNTTNLLDYCKDHNAVLHAIDPAPRIDVDQLQDEYGDSFTMHQNLSLNVLGTISPIDMVLIDGDHNWYTVYHELKILEKSAQRTENFPLVLLHDVQWPYGRRDVYYDPQNIPEIYRQPFRQQDIPTEGSLDEDCGTNSTMNNAVYENNIRNGVKTAIEDFLQETPLDLHYKEIDGMHGLGIIMNPRHSLLLAPLLSEMTASPRMHMHIDKIEKERCQLANISTQSQAELHTLGNAHTHIQDAFLRLREAYSTSVKKIVMLEQLQADNIALQQSLADLGSENMHLQQSLADLGSENMHLKKELCTERQQYAHILQTLSWRSTRILRFVGSLTRTMRSR